MAEFPNFTLLPAEIRTQILEDAVDAALTPRLAVLTVAMPPGFHHVLQNLHYLIDFPALSRNRNFQALLTASSETRDVASRAIVGAVPRESPSSDPAWALSFLGLTDTRLARDRDILLLRSSHLPFNVATALGLVMGRAFPNIMLLARDFAQGGGRTGVQPNVEPVAQSLSLLRNTTNVQYNRLFYGPGYGGPQGLLQHPEMPQNLYFMLSELPAGPCPSEHAGRFCVHYDQLSIVSSDRVEAWEPRMAIEEEDQVDDILRIWAGWRELNVTLPNLFFARIRRAS